MQSIQPERSEEYVREFMNKPEIYRYAAEYGAGPIEPEIGGREFWLSYVIDGAKVGLASLHVVTGAMIQCHPYILRDYKEHYISMIKSIFKWFVGNMPPYAVKLNALIPTIFKATIDSVIEAGGKVEGIDRQSFRYSETRVYDRVLMGITREEMANG